MGTRDWGWGPGTRTGTRGRGLGMGAWGWGQGQGTGTRGGDQEPRLGSGTGAGIGNRGWGGVRDWDQEPGLGSGTGTGIGNRGWGPGPGLGTRTGIGIGNQGWDWEPGLGTGAADWGRGQEPGPGLGTGIGNRDWDQEPGWGPGPGMGSGTGTRNRGWDRELGLGLGTGDRIGDRDRDRDWDWDWDWEPGLGSGTGAGIGNRDWEPGLGTGTGNWEPGTGTGDRGPGSGTGSRLRWAGPQPLTAPLRSVPVPVPIPVPSRCHSVPPPPLSAPFRPRRHLALPARCRPRSRGASVTAPPPSAPRPAPLLPSRPVPAPPWRSRLTGRGSCSWPGWPPPTSPPSSRSTCSCPVRPPPTPPHPLPFIPCLPDPSPLWCPPPVSPPSGLYGHDGILPVRRALRPGGRGLRELLGAEPTLLWLSPRAGLAAERGAELLCLLGAAAAIGALLSAALRGCLLLAAMHAAYLSLYQVGQVFLYFQWDSLLLEAGFLGVLVAPLRLFRWRSAAWRPHDGVTFWLVRWLLFRLMFASGVVKLTSRCPTWWGLTALTYHYETQCIPTPAAWFAHQLPVWFQKLSVVATYVIEIAVPPLFFAPIRRLRLFAFYCQVLLQVLIILTGNYNFFNALTIVLAFSLLDEEHVASWLGRSKKKHPSSWPPSLLAFLSTLLELAAYALLLYWSVQHFGLEIDWEKKVLESKVAFTYHEFTQWLRTVTLPLVGVGFLSLSWEILCALYRCISVRGCFWKLWALLQWGVFATAAVGVFAVSLVPFTYIDYESNGKLWPGIHHMFNAVERFQVVNSYGLFRRMTGVGGRPEVVLEGSYDKQTWTEIEFMYKPGNVSAAPPLVAPHQPRLDWQMWFAALGHHSSSPWFASFVYRLLQGKKDVIRLVQLDEAKYPFSAQPPTYIRAQLYKYWFTGSAETGEGATRWWRRQHVQEFFPTVSLGDPTLESLLAQHGLKDKAPPKRPATTFLPWLLESIRHLSLPFSGPVVLWSLYLGAASAALLRALGRRPRGGAPPARHKGPKRGDPVDRGGGEKNGQVRRKEEREERGEGRARGAADGEGPRGTKRKK
uniref:Lipase maturation factor n=1 Tax=Anas platyrhynchos TaxID=8839 RepID=A0A8B9T7U3_ANAPL